ncbi:MAG: ribonuclease HII [Bacteroidales bacterium]|nr:ribonuclease HII [Bacteroidales bacterium]
MSRSQKRLLSFYKADTIEAGCDEAGRGCLAGPVFAAAVILPPDFKNSCLNDSKQISDKKRYELRIIIENEAIAWSVASISNQEIDKINILQASIKAMHLAVEKLLPKPELLLIDGNRFKPYPAIPHVCFVKGDGRFMAIAAASILAKTYRDDFMKKLHKKYPVYNWGQNKGYPTKEHRSGIMEAGASPYHRKSFQLLDRQLKIDLK